MTDERIQSERRVFPALAAAVLIAILAAALTYQTSSLREIEDSLDAARIELESSRKEIAELRQLNTNQQRLLIDFAERGKTGQEKAGDWKPSGTPAQ